MGLRGEVRKGYQLNNKKARYRGCSLTDSSLYLKVFQHSIIHYVQYYTLCTVLYIMYSTTHYVQYYTLCTVRSIQLPAAHFSMLHFTSLTKNTQKKTTGEGWNPSTGAQACAEWWCCSDGGGGGCRGDDGGGGDDNGISRKADGVTGISGVSSAACSLLPARWRDPHHLITGITVLAVWSVATVAGALTLVAITAVWWWWWWEVVVV